MKTDLKKDMSVLTTINELTLTKLIDKVMWCICDTLERTIANKESVAEIDIGIGVLLINVDNNEIRYKFKPSSKFEKVVTNTVVNEQNDLVLNLEESLVAKITNTYKNFL